MPASIPAAEQATLRAEGLTVLRDVVAPAYGRLLTMMREEYLPQARTTLAATAMPDGAAFYKSQIEKFTTLDAHGRRRSTRSASRRSRASTPTWWPRSAQAGFTGTMAEFFTFLRTDPAVLREDAERTAVALRVRVQEGRLEAAGDDRAAAALPARHSSRARTRSRRSTPGRGGLETCLMNTYNLPARTLYTIPALTLHECTPGHSFQAALALEGPDRPPFRRGTSFSGYGEGWGLYTEWLGTLMGIYETPYEDFGRLTYEMWRAVPPRDRHRHSPVRLDAAAGASTTCATHAALSEHEITTEIDRYISWPGQALAYKLGEIQIRRHRREAEAKLGARLRPAQVPRRDPRARLRAAAGAGGAHGEVHRRRRQQSSADGAGRGAAGGLSGPRAFVPARAGVPRRGPASEHTDRLASRGWA